MDYGMEQNSLFGCYCCTKLAISFGDDQLDQPIGIQAMISGHP